MVALHLGAEAALKIAYIADFDIDPTKALHPRPLRVEVSELLD
jgi:hypothetical protein